MAARKHYAAAHFGAVTV